ncbi:uncharacterized protein CC84DRAFT_840263 [Paraphaeosphaeria sporulosa]|uniref:Uncharacterized protein n=1 Tax=Paraphaeosphaeria sporulosa TaxID=1460663 RepID=A0A177C7R5_9PLEO|nr:uncharacterized protein CC84DRAFT_840263 [Paraphaeosphaeria sporulosa]OAG03446.1 hypothetical protein CC84DRAFT_840263 [Paraphaeosphaeria sporulosa]
MSNCRAFLGLHMPQDQDLTIFLTSEGRQDCSSVFSLPLTTDKANPTTSTPSRISPVMPSPNLDPRLPFYQIYHNGPLGHPPFLLLRRTHQHHHRPRHHHPVQPKSRLRHRPRTLLLLLILLAVTWFATSRICAHQAALPDAEAHRRSVAVASDHRRSRSTTVGGLPVNGITGHRVFKVERNVSREECAGRESVSTLPRYEERYSVVALSERERQHGW